MNITSFIALCLLKSQGKTTTLATTDAKYIKFLALGNFYKNAWVNEPGQDWNSTYNPAVSAGTVTATDTFSIPVTIYSISSDRDDYIRIFYNGSTTKYSDFALVPPEKLKDYLNVSGYVAQVGTTLKFSQAFTSSSLEYGGTIYVPGYVMPADMVSTNPGVDTVPVDDPHWLATRVAAEAVRTDLVRQNQYPNLIAEANELMKKMKENNGPQYETVTMRQAGFGGRTW